MEIDKFEDFYDDFSLFEDKLRPPELLQKVFSFLPPRDLKNACLVCTRWRNVSYSSKILWKHRTPKLNLNSSNTHGKTVLKSLTLRGIKSLQILSCKSQRNLNKLLGAELSNFSQINLSGSTMTEFDKIYTLSGLYGLNMSLCKVLDDFNLARIIYSAENIVDLDLGGCSGLSDKGLLLIRVRLENLKILNLRSGSFGDKGLEYIASDGEKAYENFQPFLSSFSYQRNQPQIAAPNHKRKYSQLHNFNQIQVYQSQQQQNDPTISMGNCIRRNNDQIMSMSMSSGPHFCYGIFSESNAKIAMLKALGQGHHIVGQGQNSGHQIQDNLIISADLKNPTLVIQEPMRIYHQSSNSSSNSNESFNSQNQRKRDSNGKVKCQSLPELVCKIPSGKLQLTSLNFQDCQKITDLCLQSINTIKSLKSLNLSFCLSITDNGLKYLTLTSLEELNLRSCENITSSGIRNLSLENLQSLDLSFNDKISDLTKLGHLKCLSKLSVSACPIDHKNGIKFGLCHNFNLKILYLGQCKGINDESLEEISRNLSKLEFIDLYGCPVGPRGIDCLMKNLKYLEKINLGLWDLKAKL